VVSNCKAFDEFSHFSQKKNKILCSPTFFFKNLAGSHQQFGGDAKVMEKELESIRTLPKARVRFVNSTVFFLIDILDDNMSRTQVMLVIMFSIYFF
jgi:hypothetical protein